MSIKRMDLEVKADKILEVNNYCNGSILEWDAWNNALHSVGRMATESRKKKLIMYLQIDKLIDEADPIECSFCRSPYIRECKKWMLKNDFKKEFAEEYKQRVK